jgi:hypothetical protein
MQGRLERLSLLAAPLAIALWIVGLVITNSFSDKIPAHATDEQLLTWVQGNANSILFGGWLFMIGCLALIWFAAILRSRLAEAEGGAGTFSNLAFAGAAVAAVFGMLTAAGDISSAINKDDVTATAVGTLHNSSDMFFVGAELSMILFFLGCAVVALRTRVLPKWWAIVAIVIAVVLVIGPIGWAALIFAMPLWLLGTSWLLFRGSGQPHAATEPLAV